MRNLRRHQSSAMFASETVRIAVKAFPCLGSCSVPEGGRASSFQKSNVPALVRRGHGHSTITVVAIVLRRALVRHVLLRLTVHRRICRVGMMLRWLLAGLLGILRLRWLIRARKGRRLGIRWSVASVLRHV